MPAPIHSVKAKAQTWRSRALGWCIERPLTAWFLTLLLFINYLIDLAQSFL